MAMKRITLFLLFLVFSAFAEEVSSVSIIWAGMEDGVNRVGTPMHFSVLLENSASTATPEGVIRLALPAGVRADATTPAEAPLPSLDAYGYRFFHFLLEADAPVSGVILVQIEYPGCKACSYEANILFTAPLGLPKADYVPVPHPISTGEYQIGALYFPGWDGESNGGWQRIWRRTPERKPMLGWYDEGNPEAIDWHIKWLVENGISYLAVDWYWDRGNTHLDHFLNAFKKCRYRSYMKIALMWANHLTAGAHSEEDSYEVARHWVKEYFSMPEYLKIDGKPLIMIWSAEGMNRDMKEHGGVARVNQIFQEVAREAGYPGVHICGMKLPEARTNNAQIQRLKDQGYDSTFIYRYKDARNVAPGTKRYSFQELVDTSADYWWERFCVGTLPFFVNITSGWDDRPWNNHLEIYGKTPERFKAICQAAKQFADDMHLEKWIMLGPVNEWGEGSYIEPCTEYGFGMYEAVRDTFGVKPADGWPVNYAPSDVGLGPYDLPHALTSEEFLGDWDFTDRLHGWRGRAQIREVVFEDGAMSFTTSGRDPILYTTQPSPFPAEKYHKVTIRLKVIPDPETKQEWAQIFWKTPTENFTETKMVGTSYSPTGEYQELTFQLDKHDRWKGPITSIRFDPLTRKGARISIDRIWIE